MSIQSEIDRLQAAKSAIAAALQAMGVEPPQGTTLDQYAAQLTAIAASAPWLPLRGGTLQGSVKIPEEFSLATTSADGEELIRLNRAYIQFLNGLGGVNVGDESEGDQVPVLAFFGAYGDEHVILRYIANPKKEYDAANKGYVDNAIETAVTGAIEGAY